jgi:hypothetical protein
MTRLREGLSFTSSPTSRVQLSSGCQAVPEASSWFSLEGPDSAKGVARRPLASGSGPIAQEQGQEGQVVLAVGRSQGRDVDLPSRSVDIQFLVPPFKRRTTVLAEKHVAPEAPVSPVSTRETEPALTIELPPRCSPAPTG